MFSMEILICWHNEGIKFLVVEIYFFVCRFVAASGGDREDHNYGCMH